MRDLSQMVSEIKARAELGKPIVKSTRSRVIYGKLSFDDLVFVPAQLARLPRDYYREEIDATTIIGKGDNALKLSTPIMIAAMSFGSISKEAKIALAKAASMVGTATNTGEGGMLPEERKEAKILIAQYASGRFGVDENYLKGADAIEIKIGQGAKPGSGGLLPGEKVTEEIARVRKVPVGKDIHSPAHHPDILSLEDLKEKVKWLREVSGNKPIILKLGAGDVERDVEIAVKAGVDAIAIDGKEGATGAAPAALLDNVGIPTIAALVRARRKLDEMDAKQTLIISGGLNHGGDVAKALALGADAVYMATAMLVAMGCTQCGRCYTGKCPVGIATQDPELRKRLNVEEAARKVANFIRACTEEVKMIAAACGYDNVHKLSKSDLRALNELIAKLTGVELV